MFWPRVCTKDSQQLDMSSKRLAKELMCSTGLAIWLCGSKYSKKECLNHVTNHAHANVILNKNQGKL